MTDNVYYQAIRKRFPELGLDQRSGPLEDKSASPRISGYGRIVEFEAKSGTSYNVPGRVVKDN